MRTKQDHMRLLTSVIEQVLQTQTSYHLKCPPYYKFSTFRSEFYTLAQDHPRREEFVISSRRMKNLLVIAPKLPDTSLIEISPESTISQTYLYIASLIPPEEERFLDFFIAKDYPTFQAGLSKEKKENPSLNDRLVLLIYLLFHRNKFLPGFSTDYLAKPSAPSTPSTQSIDEWDLDQDLDSGTKPTPIPRKSGFQVLKEEAPSVEKAVRKLEQAFLKED